MNDIINTCKRIAIAMTIIVIVVLIGLTITWFTGCAVDTVEPQIIEDEINYVCPIDWQHKEFPWRCISCDSLNMHWQKIYIDTLK